MRCRKGEGQAYVPCVWRAVSAVSVFVVCGARLVVSTSLCFAVVFMPALIPSAEVMAGWARLEVRGRTALLAFG